MDALSEVLRVVRLEGAVFYNAEYSAPWSFRAPPSRILTPYFAPNGGHVIIFHLLTEGRAQARVEGGKNIQLEAGDIVVFPHGESHIMENGLNPVTVDNEKELLRIMSQGLKLATNEGRGELTKFVCGYLSCHPRLSNVFLSALPGIFKVNIRDGSTGRWLEDSLRFSVMKADASDSGGTLVLSKLSEVLFIETLRRYIASLPQNQTGWLAGSRDPEIGKALALIHNRPAHDWTIAELAKHVGLSRSVLAERFREFIGQPPMSYLTFWRLQLGAELLLTTSYGVAQIALEVGYESEAAFNRAFKKQFEVPPARYRVMQRTMQTPVVVPKRASAAVHAR
jgi:AraC-like DNA-binding protein